jgi:hypothetical protein
MLELTTEDVMTPGRARAIDEWWARHPYLTRLTRVIGYSILAGTAAWVLFGLIVGAQQEWPTWQTRYQHAGGWSLRLETLTGPPVTVDTYDSQESCEEVRAWKMRQAYDRNQPVPPLSCMPKYQGWRRLLYASHAPAATRPAHQGRSPLLDEWLRKQNEEILRKELEK